MHLSFNTKDVIKKRLGIILYSQDNLKLCCLVLRTERPEGYSTGKLDRGSEEWFTHDLSHPSREAMTVKMVEEPRKWHWCFGGRISGINPLLSNGLWHFSSSGRRNVNMTYVVARNYEVCQNQPLTIFQSARKTQP